MREEYQQFMEPIIQDNSLAPYYKVIRYLDKIQNNFKIMRDQLKQMPHNVSVMDNLSVGIILLLGDMETRWYIE